MTGKLGMSVKLKPFRLENNTKNKNTLSCTYVTFCPIHYFLCRYWGEENYQKLLDIKMKWDPTMVFGCHHCVGDEEDPEDITKDTLPYWRFRVNTE